VQCQEILELRTQFGRLQRDMIAKFKECNTCIDSTERLNQDAITMAKNLEDILANVSNVFILTIIVVILLFCCHVYKNDYYSINSRVYMGALIFKKKIIVSIIISSFQIVKNDFKLCAH
jgi:hypothetical protein